jgi:hypothetical protein
MTKQMFIYEDVKPISKARHGDWSVKTGEHWRFTSQINSVPVLISEFAQAARHYPIVFTGDDDRVIPVAMLGIRNGQNTFLQADGSWAVPYVPAFLRQYPYVFAQSKEENKLMLCIDEAFDGANTEGRGERLFDSEGDRTGYLDQMLEFAKSYQAQFRRAEQFGQRLRELKLLEQMRAQFNLEGQQGETLSGFYSVTRSAVNDLSDEDVLRLQRSGMLEAIYMQQMSLGNFDDIVQAMQKADTAA